jgi:hypothetical protein
VSLAEVAGRGNSHVVTEIAALTAVYEGLHRLDARVMEWKQMHMRLVWSQLGGHPDVSSGSGRTMAGNRPAPTSLRGRPITDLERMRDRPLFPKLWCAFGELYRRATPGASAEADSEIRDADDV